MEWPSYDKWEEEEKGMSFSDSLRISQTKAGQDFTKPKTHAKSKDTDASKEKNWLQKLDGQGNGGTGGRLAGAAAAISKFQGYREASKWKGDDSPDPVRRGESKNPYTITDEGYAGSRMKTGEGPQTTLLRDIDVETGKRKKKNKNYDY